MTELKREITHISYVDIDQTTIFDIRGVLAPTKEKAEEIIVNEVKAVLPKVFLPDIKIYWNGAKENDYGFSGDAKVIIQVRTMNRSPVTLK